MRTAICTTTIFRIEDFLTEYSRNLRRFGHEKQVTIYIAGDRKSPPECAATAASFRSQGIDVRFLDIGWQLDYLKRYPDLAAVIPENSDNRRNVAYLLALEEGADLVISVDDDNFPTAEEDFVKEHSVVSKSAELPTAVGEEGWFNLCTLLNPASGTPPDARLYPRGFPYRNRKAGTGRIGASESGKIGVNVGLWTLDPDVDAIGRLYAAPRISSVSKQAVLLGRGVRSPINTQNTALSRAAMGAYYYVRMGVPLRGMKLDRFGDIFSGYFLQVCAEAVGDRVRIGSPVAEHRRNAHNLLVDLYNELAGIMVVEDLGNFFSTLRLPGDSYLTAYRALAVQLENFTSAQEGFIWQAETKQYFRDVSSYMRIWADVAGSFSHSNP